MWSPPQKQHIHPKFLMTKSISYPQRHRLFLDNTTSLPSKKPDTATTKKENQTEFMPIYNHRHQNAITVFSPETIPQPPQQPPSTSKQNPKFLSILLQSLIMVSVISLFFIFIGVATIIFMHLCVVGGARHRSRNRQRPISGNGEISSGLSLDLVNSLPVLSNQGEDVSVCAICLEDVGIGDLIRVLGCCDHVFHLSCVDKWLVKVPACPTCRRNVELPGRVREEDGFDWNRFGTACG